MDDTTLQRQTTRCADLFTQFQRVTDALSRTTELQDACDVLARCSIEVVGAKRAFVYIADPSSTDDRALSLCAQVDVESEKSFDGEKDGLAAALEAYRGCTAIYLRSTARLPLLANDLCVGVLQLEFGSPRDLDAVERAFLATLGQLGAREIERARREGSERSRALVDKSILGVIAHECRHPLSVIILRATMLRRRAARTGIDADWEGEIQVLLRNAYRMNQLLGDALSFSQIERGQLRVTPRTQNLAALLRQAVENSSAPQRVTLVAPEQAEAEEVLCDPGRILQVIDNLLGNALKFTPPDGSVTLRARVGQEVCEIEVEDSGRGIDPGDMAHLFAVPEHLAGRTRRKKREGEGAGLGLYVAKSLVEAHGGDLSAESTVGEGSRFFFSLPLASAGAPDTAGANTIVVVDDDYALRREIVEVFERQGYAAVAAANGREALDYLDHHPQPALILADLMMPVMDGWELLAELQMDPALRCIPVVILSCVRKEPSLPKVAAYLQKPVTLNQLISLAAQYCEQTAVPKA